MTSIPSVTTSYSRATTASDSSGGTLFAAASPISGGEEGKKGKEGKKRASVTAVACRSCQKRKTKCDGKRPSCTQCANKKQEPCVYDLGKDERRTQFLRKKLLDAQNAVETLQRFVRAVANTSDSQAAVAVAQKIVECGYEDVEALVNRLLALDAPSHFYEGSNDTAFADLLSLDHSPDIEDDDPMISRPWDPREDDMGGVDGL